MPENENLKNDALIWTEERLAVLSRMASEGACAHVIALRLGVSRSAVIGRAIRTKSPFLAGFLSIPDARCRDVA